MILMLREKNITSRFVFYCWCIAEKCHELVAGNNSGYNEWCSSNYLVYKQNNMVVFMRWPSGGLYAA